MLGLRSILDAAASLLPKTRNFRGSETRARVKTITRRIAMTLYFPDFLTYELIA